LEFEFKHHTIKASVLCIVTTVLSMATFLHVVQVCDVISSIGEKVMWWGR